MLLLGHPELPHTASELVNLYRVTDTVEKDFQAIKSVIRLRPLFCYTDPKVQAHVTLCMPALLIERTLENQLRAAECLLSAPARIEELEPCRLNQRESDEALIYHLTRANAAQCEILAALDLEQLAEDEYLRDRIVPHPLPEPAPAARRCQRQARRQAE